MRGKMQLQCVFSIGSQTLHVQCLFYKLCEGQSHALNMDNSKCYVARCNSADWHFEGKRMGGFCALLNDANDASLIFVTASITLHHMYIGRTWKYIIIHKFHTLQRHFEMKKREKIDDYYKITCLIFKCISKWTCINKRNCITNFSWRFTELNNKRSNILYTREYNTYILFSCTSKVMM